MRNDKYIQRISTIIKHDEINGEHTIELGVLLAIPEIKGWQSVSFSCYDVVDRDDIKTATCTLERKVRLILTNLGFSRSTINNAIKEGR